MAWASKAFNNQSDVLAFTRNSPIALAANLLLACTVVHASLSPHVSRPCQIPNRSCYAQFLSSFFKRTVADVVLVRLSSNYRLLQYAACLQPLNNRKAFLRFGTLIYSLRDRDDLQVG